jgi:hypothetical protein
MSEHFSKQNRHGYAMTAVALTLGVPAFAGTTRYFVSAGGPAFAGTTSRVVSTITP